MKFKVYTAHFGVSFHCCSSEPNCRGPDAAAPRVIRYWLKVGPVRGSRVVRIHSLRYQAGCRTRRLNQV